MKEFEGINKEEIQKAAERIQAEHPIRFGKAFDVSIFNCSEVSEFDRIIETIQKKTTDDVEWNLICQMAIAYINESKGRVEVIKKSPNIPIEYAYPKGCTHSGYYDPTRELLFIGCITTEYAKSIGVEWEVIEEWRPSKNERPQGEWIPVSERLPEEGKMVLVWFEYYRYGDYNCMYQTHGFCRQFDERWSRFINGETGWKDARIIAWMPLPLPYEEAENE